MQFRSTIIAFVRKEKLVYSYLFVLFPSRSRCVECCWWWRCVYSPCWRHRL